MEVDEITNNAIGAAIEVHIGGWKVGLLINFNVPLLKQGIKRLVHNFDG
jgi:hypothetical protein